MVQQTMNFTPVGNQLSGLTFDPKNTISDLERIIGRLPNETKYDYVENQARTFGDLTELLLKRGPPIVKMQVTGLLEKSYISPYTTMMLPIRQLAPYESINFEWTELNFNPAFMPQVEVLGVGRYFTHNKTRRGARAVRRGAAVKIEAGFFMTPEGREEWKMQIEQLATAISETNEYDVLLTLLQVPMRHVVHAQDMQGPTNNIFYGKSPDMSFEERLELMRDMFGLVNKTTDSRGFSALITNLKTIMKRNSTTPDVLVVPPYLMGHYYHSNDDLWHYMSAGPQALVNRAMASDVGDDDKLPIRVVDGLKVVDTHIYRPVKGARNSACDLLTVPVQIGEKFSMEINMIYRDLKGFKNYSSSDRDVRIFNEDQGRFVTVYFLDAVRNSFRWDESTGAPHSNHAINTTGGKPDMFKNGGSTVVTWGDVEGQFLPHEALTRVATTMLNIFSEADITILNDITQANDAAYKNLLTRAINLFSSAIVVDDVSAAIIDLSNNNTTVGVGSSGINGTQTDHKTFFSAGSSGAIKALGVVFLFSRVNFNDFKKLHELDIFIPIDVLICRPWMKYNVSSVVMMKAGQQTGETVLGQQRFNMSSNTQDGTIEGAMTYYVKAIVKNTRNVLVAPHVFIQSYIGGSNTTFVDKVGLAEIQSNSGVFNSKQSMIAMLIPFNSNVHEYNWIDYRGRNPNVDQDFHGSAEYYKNVFNVEDTDVYSPMDNFVDYEDQTYPANTICWSGHLEYGRDFKFKSFCLGHLGPNTYDQVNASRKEGLYSPIYTGSRANSSSNSI